MSRLPRNFIKSVEEVRFINAIDDMAIDEENPDTMLFLVHSNSFQKVSGSGPLQFDKVADAVRKMLKRCTELEANMSNWEPENDGDWTLKLIFPPGSGQVLKDKTPQIVSYMESCNQVTLRN